jgi:hypothetical protein
MAMILPGMDVINLLRAHISYEQEMLGRIAEMRTPPKRASGRKKTGKKTYGKQRRRAAKRKETKPTHVLPYTLEPHPEL